MADHSDTRQPRQSQSPTGHSVSLFRIFDIEIRLDISVIIIFFLIVFSLASGVFPQWHPDWSTTLTWGTALVSGILFFASLLAHELSHSVVSQYFGIPVPRITLFLFGGMAEISREADRPKVEFLVAIAGPLMSILIALICTNVAFNIVADPEVARSISEGNVEALSQLGPVATSLFWLGSINMIIAIFNMIPGFPMDGGRVFRAAIWGLTGNLVTATRWASNAGRYFGWLLMGLGVVSLFGGGGLGGIWWILIGWFISSLAAMSYRQLLTDNMLHRFKVSDLMRTRFDTVSPEMDLPGFVDDYLLRSNQRLWPVVRDGDLQGTISLSNVASLSGEKREGKSVGDVMESRDSMPWLEEDTDAREAFQLLAGAGDEPLPVIRDGQVVGLIQHGDIIKWMTLHQDEHQRQGQ